MNYKLFLRILGTVTVLLTIVPLFAADYWWIRMFDFPHTQLTLLTLFALVAYIARFEIDRRGDFIFVGILTICFVFQLSKIISYLPVSPEPLQDAEQIVDKRVISLMTVNVYQDNDKENKVSQLLDSTSADLVLLTETNQRWIDSLKPLSSKFPHQVQVPLENTYGMYLISKLKLIDPRVYTLVDDSIPSIDTRIRLKSGDTLQLFCIHPTPPMPQENPTSTARDAELMLTAEMSRKADLPVIVMGDFNDVPWSATTELFTEYSGLLDPRKGRGLVNTYSADNILMRWPLDHIFVSPEFRFLDMERGPDVGSDHFPLYLKLSYDPVNWEEQEPPAPEQGTRDRAHEIIRKARQDYSNENLRYQP